MSALLENSGIHCGHHKHYAMTPTEPPQLSTKINGACEENTERNIVSFLCLVSLSRAYCNIPKCQTLIQSQLALGYECFLSTVFKLMKSHIITFPNRKLYPELCQGIVDVAISSVFTMNSSGDSSSASSSPYSSSPSSSSFTTNSCSSPKLRAPLHVGPFTRL